MLSARYFFLEGSVLLPRESRSQVCVLVGWRPEDLCVVWQEMRECPQVQSKARLKTEKTNKNEHKNKASIYIFFQGDEPQLFWMSLHDHNNSSMESDDESVVFDYLFILLKSC